MIDFIGDIHGYAHKLEELLQKMHYVKKGGVYAHKTRKVLFVGDYIDRGPQIRETLALVKAMADTGNAIALMGNHEYNALCFHTPTGDGHFLREHSFKNRVQHEKTLKQFENYPDQFEEYLHWFKTLPLYYETNAFRAVHACWDNDNIDFLRKTLVDDRLTDALLRKSVMWGTDFNDAIDQTLKGKELNMPDGQSFTDKDGAVRSQIRIKWWENPLEMTYKSISVEPLTNLPDREIDNMRQNTANHYRNDEKMVFFGHYWLRGRPSLYRQNICCLDYSVAKKGKLVAYRLNEETSLDPQNLVYV